MYNVAKRILDTCRHCLLLVVTIALNAQNQTVSVMTFGASNDGTNAAATTAAFKQAFAAAAPGGKVVVPGGSYAIDNSSGGFVIAGYNGQVIFEGTSRILLQSNSDSGVVFSGGTDTRLDGVHITYQTPPTSAHSGIAGLVFNGSSNVRASDTTVENCPGYGVWFSNALESKLLNVNVMNCLDDGIRFENSRNSEISNATVLASARNGLDFVTAPNTADRNGATASNIIVNASGQGIAVTGTSRVTVTTFYVDSVSASGVYCGNANSAALPEGVAFNGGQITNVGGFGIEIASVASCSMANVQVLNSGAHGVSVQAPQGTVGLRNIRVSNNLNGDAFNISATKELLISESSGENGPGYGFYFDSVARVVASGLTTVDVSTASSLHRAIWFQNLTSLTATNLTVQDDQATATGYIVGSFNIAHGSMSSIASNILFGSLILQNPANLPVLLTTRESLR